MSRLEIESTTQESPVAYLGRLGRDGGRGKKSEVIIRTHLLTDFSTLAGQEEQECHGIGFTCSLLAEFLQ